MLALLCRRCDDLRGLPPVQGDRVVCRCGNAWMWWRDAAARRAVVRADDREAVRVVALRDLLLDAPQMSDADWRHLHGEACRAPGSAGDSARRSCWAVVLRVGETADVSWDGVPEPDAAVRPATVTAIPPAEESGLPMRLDG